MKNLKNKKAVRIDEIQANIWKKQEKKLNMNYLK